jgi:hypothetical protein
MIVAIDKPRPNRPFGSSLNTEEVKALAGYIKQVRAGATGLWFAVQKQSTHFRWREEAAMRTESFGAGKRFFVAGPGLLTVLVMLALILAPGRAGAQSASDADPLKELPRIRAQMDKDRKEARLREERQQRKIEELERQVQALGSKTSQQTLDLTKQDAKTNAIQTQLAQESAVVAKIQSQPPEQEFKSSMDRFLGSHRFTLVGDFAVDYKWNDRDHKNSFSLENFAPIFLYQAGDNLLFEAEVEFKLAAHEDEIPEVEYAQADYIVNKYLTLVAGKYTLPFGDYLEREHQKWVMKLVDRPLPYRAPDQGGIMFDFGLGVEARGAVPLGYGEGAFAEYTLFVNNGPFYDSAARGAFVGDNAVDNNQGKGYGARIGVDLLPIKYEMGRLHFSASTFDGTWDTQVSGKGGKIGDNLWFTSWGVGMDYQKLPFELRGEYLQTKRNMGPLPNDKREGWYIEGSYYFNELPVDYINRMGAVLRWSGVNQNVIDTPADSFTAFTRKPRQLAFGIDYWLHPSVVVKFEYERTMQHEARDFNSLMTSFAYGF